MRGGVVVLASALVLGLFIPTVAAQGPPLGPEDNIIWNQYTTEGGCCTTFGSTMKDDPRFQGSGNFGTLVLLPAASDTEFRLDYALTEQEFPYAVELDPEGTVDFTVNLGGGISTGGAAGVAVVDVAVQLTVGDTVVASGSGEQVIDAAHDGYKTVTYSVAPQITTLDPADGPIQWSIILTGAANGVYVSHTDQNGNGWVEIPIISGGPAASPTWVYSDLAEPMVEHAFTNATSDIYVLNFTTTLEDATANFAWSSSAGVVNATLRDNDGAVVFAERFSGEGDVQAALAGAEAGDWNLTLAYEGFNGTFAFSLERPSSGDAGSEENVTETGSETATTTQGPSEDGTGNATTNETLAGGDPGEEASALPFVLATLALVAVARWRRR